MGFNVEVFFFLLPAPLFSNVVAILFYKLAILFNISRYFVKFYKHWDSTYLLSIWGWEGSGWNYAVAVIILRFSSLSLSRASANPQKCSKTSRILASLFLDSCGQKRSLHPDLANVQRCKSDFKNRNKEFRVKRKPHLLKRFFKKWLCTVTAIIAEIWVFRSFDDLKFFRKKSDLRATLFELTRWCRGLAWHRRLNRRYNII